MSLALYIDENVHAAITNGLRSRGIDILTVQEDERAGLADPLVLDRAVELGRILFTQDRDFLIEANRRQAEGISFIGIVYGHKLMISIGDCIRDLEIIAQIGTIEEFQNRVQFLPL